MDLKEAICDGSDWIRLAQGRNQSSEHDNEPSGSIKDGESLDQLSDS
jgi:hypothetical protein